MQWFDWDHVQFHRGRNLPHFEQAGAIYFITFRLWDSLPAEVYQELFAARDQWLGNNPPPYTWAQELELKRVYSLPLERFLDEGHGRCGLRDEGLRDELVDIMLCFDGEAYEVGEFVVMPNHVHLLMRSSRKTTMRKVCRRWKNLSARAINQTLGRRGRVWQSEGFDHIVRSRATLEQCRQYIRDNPRHLRAGEFTLGCGRLCVE